LSGCVAAIRRGSNYPTHFGHVAFHSADSNEFGVRHFCDDVGQRGLSAPWRAGEDHRRQTIGFNGAAEKFAGAKDVFLADKFLQRARAHPRGERRRAVGGFNVFLLLEKIVHLGNYGAPVMQAILAARSGGLKPAAGAIWIL
jgi:hypothetical protein